MAGPSRIDELRKKFDENPRRYFAPLANEYRKSGDFEQAIFICQEFLPQQPGHMSGHIVYGQALFESGRHDEARSVFETALSLDPENLIALRHLGDIARAQGDNETARAWYRRVLESDPRNDEIAGILASLDSDAGATPAATSAPPAAAESVSTDETVIEKAPTESAIDFVTQGQASTADPIVTEPLTAAPAEGSFDDIAKLFTSAAPAPAAAAEPVPPGSSGAFTFVHEGEDVLGQAARMLEPESSQRQEKPLPAESPLAGLPTFSEGPSASPAAPSSFLENLTSAEPPAAEPPRQAVAPPPAPAPTQAPTPSADASKAFVTETMAELYVQQGHVDRAIDVYRQLVKMRPNETALLARLRELDGSAQPRQAEESVSSAPASVESVAEAGPTIRDFLAGIAEFRPRAEASADDFATTAAAEPPRTPEPPRASARDATVGGSLNDLFAGAERSADRAPVPAADARPASAASSAPIPGRATSPAPTELSLDHVFRHATPAAGAQSQSSSFSFDQFFSQQAQQDVAASDAEPMSDSKAGEGDDIQQFNAWLEGLKKT